MVGIYRPTIIRYVDTQGHRVRKGTPGARRVREKSKTFWGRCADANGKVRPVGLCDDEQAAEAMLAEMKQRAKRIARGDIDPFEDHRKRPLAEHVEDFRSFLESKGNTTSHVAMTVQRITAAFDGCKFKKLADLNAGRVAGWLADRRKPTTDKVGNAIAGLGIATSNHHLVAVKSFGNWLVKDRRSPENPFAHLSRLNARVDVRHERRALTTDELARLIQAAEQSQKTFRGRDGTTRAMLYRLAAMTGLRANELASLTPASFDLVANVPIVTVEAGYSKRRREDVLPLHSDLVTRLRQWLSERERPSDGESVILSLNRSADAKRERLFPGTWSERAAEMLRIDLAAAGIAYETDAGIADFHSLRHTFISNLVAGGVHPKLAQQLARHSTITLTMDRYSHVGLLDMSSALESLPAITAPESQTMRATGTTDDASDFGCTNGCNRPAEISRFQPLSPVNSASDTDFADNSKTLGFPGENTQNPSDGTVAQRLEQRTHNPLVLGSNPSGPTFVFARTGSHDAAQVRKRQRVARLVGSVGRLVVRAPSRTSHAWRCAKIAALCAALSRLFCGRVGGSGRSHDVLQIVS